MRAALLLLVLVVSCAHATGQVGNASYYSTALQGRTMANGLPYDERRLTCAHRSLPFGTHLRVTDLGTGREVTVTVTDRGPFVADRIIDLSRAAAARLGILERGVARVRVSREP